MQQRLQDAVNTGLGKPGALVHGLQRHGSALCLQQFHYVQGFGENGNQVKTLRRLVCQGALPLTVRLKYISLETGQPLMKRGLSAGFSKTSPGESELSFRQT